MSRPRRTARLVVTAWLTLVALAGAAPVFAQAGQKTENASFTFGGPVTAVDVAKRTITIGGDTGGTFEVDPDATLMSGDKKLKLGDVKVGWYVDGNGDLRGETNPKKVVTYLEEVDQ